MKPTDTIYKHLVIKGNVVNVFRLKGNAGFLNTFDMQRAARYVSRACHILLENTTFHNNRALGITTLGKEILASLHALYCKDDLLRKAEAAGIFTPEDNYHRHLDKMFLSSEDTVNVPPRVCGIRVVVCRSS